MPYIPVRSAHPWIVITVILIFALVRPFSVSDVVLFMKLFAFAI